MQQHERARNPNPYLKPFSSMISMMFMLLLSWILSLAVELGGIALGLWDWSHSSTLLLYELQLLSGAKINWLGVSPYELASSWVSAIGSIELPADLAFAQHFLQVCLLMLQLTIIRLVIALYSLPVIGLFAIVALVDCLVERDLRRFNAANESAWIYHWSKRLTKPWLILPVFLYLSMPVSIHPNLVFIPAALIFALGLRTTTAYLKKVL